MPQTDPQELGKAIGDCITAYARTVDGIKESRGYGNSFWDNFKAAGISCLLFLVITVLVVVAAAVAFYLGVVFFAELLKHLATNY